MECKLKLFLRARCPCNEACVWLSVSTLELDIWNQGWWYHKKWTLAAKFMTGKKHSSTPHTPRYDDRVGFLSVEDECLGGDLARAQGVVSLWHTVVSHHHTCANHKTHCGMSIEKVENLECLLPIVPNHEVRFLGLQLGVIYCTLFTLQSLFWRHMWGRATPSMWLPY